jgi:hypothetical protein
MEQHWIALASALVISASSSLVRAQSTDPVVPEASASSEAGTNVETAEAADADADDASSPEAAPNDRHGLGEALVISGVSVLAGTWVLTGATATTLVVFTNGRTATLVESWIPVVGPWIMVGDSVALDGGQLALAVISGVLQAAGLAATIAGIVLLNEPGNSAPLASLSIAPMAGNGTAGLSVSGSW